ncbi:MAG: penicillin acylase family protein [Sediminibacterium sp.]|nr:penicillin acylase family protein [Sediminibacterium sp.]
MNKKINLFLVLFYLIIIGNTQQKKLVKNYQATIIRDVYGVPHIKGKSNADAVFGLLYAQCEDDFKRIELNYVEKLGRLSEWYGPSKVFDDLQTRILLDQDEAQQDFKKAPNWLKDLLIAYAAGINYFLATHPNVKPMVINHFESWYPLLWTDGSIGAINTADLTVKDLAHFYRDSTQPNAEELVVLNSNSSENQDYKESGSNGFAIAPQLSQSGHTMLYINPHTTFYFRPEVHVQSEAGLNAYGAVTWGQFFIYQGFNENCGWMHPSTNVDVADVYAEKIDSINNQLYYEFEHKKYKVKTKNVVIKYLKDNQFKLQKFTIYYTKHGPIMAKKNGRWISLKHNNRDMKGLIQSWQRTLAKNYAEFSTVMEYCANASNNTVYADKDGNIAYWHGNFIPKRDTHINWTVVLDGTEAKNEWQGIHQLADIIQVKNPSTGWIQNCNSTPFTVAGSSSPLRNQYPSYMAPDGQNFRGLKAAELLAQVDKIDLDGLIKLGYENKIKFFELFLPKFFERTSNEVGLDMNNDIFPLYQTLKNWDYRVDENSIATTIAILWAENLNPIIRKVYIDVGQKDQIQNCTAYFDQVNTAELIQSLRTVMGFCLKKWGTWQVPWGSINRFQRINDDIPNTYNDQAQSFPVKYVSSLWGCLASFNSSFATYQKRYGYGGNSFICAVEFGPKVTAKSLLAGGNSGQTTNKHFNDQGLNYTKGIFKEIFFYDEDINKHVEKKYNLNYSY